MMDVYRETPKSVIRLPRPLLCMKHRRRINLDTHENFHNDSLEFQQHLDNVQQPRHVDPMNQLAKNNNNNNNNMLNKKINNRYSSPTPIRLSPANIAIFDDTQYDHYQQPLSIVGHESSSRIHTVITSDNRTNNNANAFDRHFTALDLNTPNRALSCNNSIINMPDDNDDDYYYHDTDVHHQQSICHATYTINTTTASSSAADANAFDTNSTVSSTHFTLVNGFGAMKYKKPTPDRRFCCCCCCSPIAGLIITMTILLAAVVFLMIFFTEYPHMTSSVVE